MLGEDPMFIARRLVILAAEDIGLANPNGLAVAVAAQQAVSFIGMPEGRIPLAEATIFLASAPKSNSAYLAIDKALGLVRESRDEPVPMHLRNATTRLMENMGYGKDYQYPHDAPGHFKPSENLPEKLQGSQFYEPGELGAEKQIARSFAVLVGGTLRHWRLKPSISTPQRRLGGSAVAWLPTCSRCLLMRCRSGLPCALMGSPEFTRMPCSLRFAAMVCAGAGGDVEEDDVGVDVVGVNADAVDFG